MKHLPVFTTVFTVQLSLLVQSREVIILMHDYSVVKVASIAILVMRMESLVYVQAAPSEIVEMYIVAILQVSVQLNRLIINFSHYERCLLIHMLAFMEGYASLKSHSEGVVVMYHAQLLLIDSHVVAFFSLVCWF